MASRAVVAAVDMLNLLLLLVVVLEVDRSCRGGLILIAAVERKRKAFAEANIVSETKFWEDKNILFIVHWFSMGDVVLVFHRRCEHLFF